MKKSLLSTLLLLCSICGFAYDFCVDGIYYNKIYNKKEVAVTYGTEKYSGIIDIPNEVEYNGTVYSVTNIGYSAFKGCTGITELKIPNSVTEIEQSAFSGCTGITELKIPNSVTYIGLSAFLGCTGITELKIPDSVTGIGYSAFSGCTGINSLTIGNSVTNIGGSAFKGCTGITELKIPNSVTEIGDHAFEGCTGITELKIPNSVTEIGNYAFKGCTSITEVKISDGSSTLKFSKSSYYSAFSDCPIENLYLGRNISYDSTDSPFINKESIKNLTIGDSVTEIGSHAFYGCTGITELKISNSVTEIGNYAFYRCTGINSLTIGNSVTYIGSSAFYGCLSITSVTSLNPIPPAITASTFDETTEKNATLHVPEGCKAVYWLNPYWENFFNIQDDVPTSIEYISTDSQEKQDKNKGIHTLNGTKVNTTNISDLPSGIYIINGKKIVVK